MTNYKDKQIERMIKQMQGCMDEKHIYKAFHKANDIVVTWIKEYSNPKIPITSIRGIIKEYNQVMQFCEPISPVGRNEDSKETKREAILWEALLDGSFDENLKELGISEDALFQLYLGPDSQKLIEVVCDFEKEEEE